MSSSRAAAYCVELNIGCDECGKHASSDGVGDGAGEGAGANVNASMPLDLGWKLPRVVRARKPAYELGVLIDKFLKQLHKPYNWARQELVLEPRYQSRFAYQYFFKLALYSSFVKCVETFKSRKLKQVFGAKSKLFRETPDESLLQTPFLEDIFNALHFLESQKYSEYKQNIIDNVKSALESTTTSFGTTLGYDADFHSEQLEKYLNAVMADMLAEMHNWLSNSGTDGWKRKWEAELEAIRDNIMQWQKDDDFESNPDIVRIGVMQDVVYKFNKLYKNFPSKYYGESDDAHDAILRFGRYGTPVLLNDEAAMTDEMWGCGPWVLALLNECIRQVRKDLSTSYSRFVKSDLLQQYKIAYRAWRLRDAEVHYLQELIPDEPDSTPPKRPPPTPPDSTTADTPENTQLAPPIEASNDSGSEYDTPDEIDDEEGEKIEASKPDPPSPEEIEVLLEQMKSGFKSSFEKAREESKASKPSEDRKRIPSMLAHGSVKTPQPRQKEPPKKGGNVYDKTHRDLIKKIIRAADSDKPTLQPGQKSQFSVVY